jgi:hypothetical protein
MSSLRIAFVHDLYEARRPFQLNDISEFAMHVAAHPNSAIRHPTSQRSWFLEKGAAGALKTFVASLAEEKGPLTRLQADVRRGLGAKRTPRTGRRTPTFKSRVSRVFSGNILQGPRPRFTIQEKLRARRVAKRKLLSFLK